MVIVMIINDDHRAAVRVTPPGMNHTAGSPQDCY